MKKTLIVIALLAAAPLGLKAQELSYSYLEAGYYHSSLSGAPDADGWGLGGSAALGSNFHIFGNWSQQELDNTSVDFDRWRVGFGYRHGLSQNLDLVARVAYEKVDFGAGLDADGYSAEVGLRGLMGSKFEGWVMAGYADGNDIDGDFYGRLGGHYKFNRSWGLVAEATFEDGANTVFFGPRFSF